MKIYGKQLKDYDVPYVLKTTAPTPTDDGYSEPTLWLDTSANKAYLLVDNTAGNATWSPIGGGIVSLLDWQASVKSIADCTATPPTEVLADRYILDSTAGTVHANWDGASKLDIVQFDGVSWDATTPNEGFACWVDDEDIVYVFNGTAWVKLGTFLTHNNLLGRTTADSHPASAISTVTTNFDGILSASEDEVQKAFDALDNHEATHIRGGNSEIDGDKLGINWLPSTYTPDTSPPEANNSGELTPHLKGIDNLLGAYKDSDFIPIEWALNGSVSPDAAEVISYGSGEIVVRKFSGTASQDLKIPWKIPHDIKASDGVKYRAVGIITESTAPSNEGMSFKLSGYSIADGESLGGATGSEYESKKTGLSHSQYDLFKTDYSDVVTISGLDSGEVAMLKLYRDHDDVDDTYAQKVGVSGVVLQFTRKMSGQWKY